MINVLEKAINDKGEMLDIIDVYIIDLQKYLNEEEEIRDKRANKKYAKGGHLFSGLADPYEDEEFDEGPGVEAFWRNTLGDDYWDKHGVRMRYLQENDPYYTPKPKENRLADPAGMTSNLLRFAEPFGNMYAVWSDATGRTNNPVTYDYIPDYTPLSFTPIGEYMPELHLDTRYAANQQAQQAAATKAAILDNIAPNRYANLLAADYNAQTAYGDLLRNAEIAEYDILLKARTFLKTATR